MLYYSIQLATKLQRILRDALEASDVSDINQLAQMIAEKKHQEFSYLRRSGTEIVQEFTSGGTIRKYVQFLIDLGMLNDELQLQTETSLVTQEEELALAFADRAHEMLEENGASSKIIQQKTLSILQDGEPRLPTMQMLHRSLSTGLSLSKFRWLIYLYLLNEAALIQYWQTPLLLPKDYKQE